jgi:hypothetical protein
MAAWEQGKPFRSLLEADPRVTLSPEQLDEAFDLTRSLRNIDRTFHALEEIERHFRTSTRARSVTSTTPAAGSCCSSRPTASRRSTS